MMLMFLITILSCSFMNGIGNPSIMLALSGVWMILSVVLFFIIRRPHMILMYTLANGVMAGVAMAACYTMSKTYSPINWIVLVVLALGGGITYSVYSKIGMNKMTSMTLSVMWVLIGVVSSVVWGFTQPHGSSWLVFLSVIGFVLNIALWIELRRGKTVEFYRIVSLYSMLMFGGIFYLVLSILSEGDTLDFVTTIEWGKKKQI